MEYTIDELRNNIFENVFNVYDIFKSRFGEQFTDLQDIPTNAELTDNLGSLKYDDSTKKYDVGQGNINLLRNQYADMKFPIYVWFPTVTITNENDRSIVIWDLYVQVEVNIDGQIPYENYGMLWNRSRYNTEQFLCNFMHSHICDIPKYDFTAFQSPCLGTASIQHTIESLKNSNDEAMWMLFCEELARAVTVESLTGHPYRYLEEVGKHRRRVGYEDFRKAPSNIYDIIRYSSGYYNNASDRYWLDGSHLMAMLKEFTIYYLKHGHFSFCYRYKRFGVGMSYYDYMVDISNAFISYYNQYLKEGEAKKGFLYRTGFLVKVMVADRKFNVIDDTRQVLDMDRYVGRHVLTFKGKDITLQIADNDAASPAPVLTTLLNIDVAMYILEYILKILNFRFSNGRDKDTGSGAEEATPKARKTVCYI